MRSERRRYFIELHPEATGLPRCKEDEARREQAARFVRELGDWLRREALDDKVAAMAITAFGQVQIICAADVMDHIRHQDDPAIAVIRPGACFVETMGRWNAARRQA